MRYKKKKKPTLIRFFKCYYYKKFLNRLMLDGKKNKIEKIVNTIFAVIKKNYKLRGILIFYEILRLLNPYVSVIALKIDAEIHHVPVHIPVKNQYRIALGELCKSIKEGQYEFENYKFSDLILMELLNFVFESVSTSILRRDEKFLLLYKNMPYFHYSWRN